MASANVSADEAAIRELISRQAARLSWARGREADWQGFADAFQAGAPMIPSSRPARPHSVGSFLDRMKSLAASTLPDFQERALGGEIRVFGNVAVALVAGETRENGTDVNRDVSGYLLIKEGGRWLIAAQAWDKESPDRPIPKTMLDPG
jgi:hypothetical protein